MSIIVHIYYSGKNGAARQFAKEMMERLATRTIDTFTI